MNEETLDQTEQTDQTTPPAPPLLPLAAPLDPAPLNALAETVAAKADAAATTAALAAKADASALTPITAALAALGGVPEGAHNLLIAHGSYKGSGTYSDGHDNSITVPFYPILLLVCGSFGSGSKPLLAQRSTMFGEDIPPSNTPNYMQWSDNSVTWRNDNSAQSQMNRSNITYYYLVLGYMR